MRSGKLTALAGAAVLTLAVAPLAAQQHQPQHQHQHQQGRMQGGQMDMDTGWKELNGFHSIMHLSHQPLMQSGDLAPARRVASELAAAARRLADTPVPETCVGDDLADQTGKLAEAAEAFAKQVTEGADDETVKASLNGVHDLMRPVMMACRKRS